MYNIYVGNLPFSTGRHEIEGLFAPFGQILRVSMMVDRETGRSRGFGFVEMPSESEGGAAVEALNGTDFQGRQLKIGEARPLKPRSQRTRGGPRGGGGRRFR